MSEETLARIDKIVAAPSSLVLTERCSHEGRIHYDVPTHIVRMGGGTSYIYKTPDKIYNKKSEVADYKQMAINF